MSRLNPQITQITQKTIGHKKAQKARAKNRGMFSCAACAFSQLSLFLNLCNLRNLWMSNDAFESSHKSPHSIKLRFVSISSRGIITTMKLFSLIAFALIGISIACVPNKSALSSSANSNAPINQPSEQPANSTEQSNTNCSLTMAAAPVLSGLKLGMTPDEVLALFPGSKDDPEVHSLLSRPPSQLGVSELVIRPAKFQSKEKYAGVNQITFRLLDGRVSNFNLGYNGPAYSHVDQFVTKFVEGTSLPSADQWQAYVGMDTQMKTLTCKDFEIRVFAGGEGGNLNYVLMRDLEADKKLKDRSKKARESATPSP